GGDAIADHRAGCRELRQEEGSHRDDAHASGRAAVDVGLLHDAPREHHDRHQHAPLIADGAMRIRRGENPSGGSPLSYPDGWQARPAGKLGENPRREELERVRRDTRAASQRVREALRVCSGITSAFETPAAVLPYALHQEEVPVRQLWFPALVMLIAVGFPVAARAETWQEQSTHDVPAAGIRSLEVENARGLVSVKRANRPWIHLEALKIVRSNDSHWARRVSRETQVVAENHGGEYTVHVVYPQRQTVRIMFWDRLSCFELPRAEVRLALEVPDGIAFPFPTRSGALTSTEVRSPQLLESTSGDV